MAGNGKAGGGDGRLKVAGKWCTVPRQAMLDRITRPFFAIACAFFAGVCGGHAAGVAAIKEQPYHRDEVAAAVAFSEILPSRGSYVTLVSGEQRVEVLESKLVARIELPDGIPAVILEEKEVVPLRETLAAVRDFMKRFPKSGPLLEKYEGTLAGHVGQFDAGEVRFEARWMSRAALAELQKIREEERAAANLTEVEKRIFEAAQRDKGLVLHDGRWVTPEEAAQRPADAATELSEAAAPAAGGTLDGAKAAVRNLTDLAAGQTGSAKVRTERLLVALRNLFLAEARLGQRMIDEGVEAREAAAHEKNAAEWLVPNSFGRINEQAALDSRKRAREVRQRSAAESARVKAELLEQLREMDVVMEDFHRLREQRVVGILAGAARAVGARHFTAAEYQPVLPTDEGE